MANNPDNPETFHEVPASKYYYLGDTIGAVPKAFFQFWSLLLITGTCISTLIACYTNWWQILIVKTLTLLFIDAWYIGVPATFITLAITYFWYTRRQSHRKQKLLTGVKNQR